MYTLSIGTYSGGSDIYVQLCLLGGSRKCAETHENFRPRDHWPIVSAVSGPPWARNSHVSLDTNCSPRCSGI